MSDFSNLTPAEKAELVDLVIAQMAATSKVAFKPIDMDNLEHLDESGDWPAEIVQLMPGNAVSAGAPDPANNKGTINWPLQDLAKRTAILKATKFGANETDQLRVSRYFDDTNVSVPYSVVADIGNAPITHSYNYASLFPGKDTKVFLQAFVNFKVSTADADFARANLGLTASDGTPITNVMSAGLELDAGTDSYIWQSCAFSGEIDIAAAAGSVSIEQRCFLDNTSATNSSCLIDNFELLIFEVVQ